jgi:hypothetical protein
MKCASARRACPRSVANQKGRRCRNCSPKRASTRSSTSSTVSSGVNCIGPPKVDVIRGGLAVVVVVVPLAALGLVAVHQEAGLAPHLAVEPLHPQFLAPLGPGLEFGMRTQEAVVGELVHGIGQSSSAAIRRNSPGFGGQHLRRAGRLGARRSAHRGWSPRCPDRRAGCSGRPALLPAGRRICASRRRGRRSSWGGAGRRTPRPSPRP